MTGVSVFDLDRTLTRRGTYSPFLLSCARRHAPWRLAFVPAVLLAMICYKSGIIDRKRLKTIMHRLMIGRLVPRHTIDRLAEAFADGCVASGCHAKALALLRAEQASGREMVLATAAHRFYATAIARRLGIAQVVATESEWRGEHLSSAIAGANCYGAAKRDALAAFLAERGLARDRAHVRFFSDDASDLPTFEWADEPCVVNAGGKLTEIARQRGWSTRRWDESAAAGGG